MRNMSAFGFDMPSEAQTCGVIKRMRRELARDLRSEDASQQHPKQQILSARHFHYHYGSGQRRLGCGGKERGHAEQNRDIGRVAQLRERSHVFAYHRTNG